MPYSFGTGHLTAASSGIRKDENHPMIIALVIAWAAVVAIAFVAKTDYRAD